MDFSWWELPFLVLSLAVWFNFCLFGTWILVALGFPGFCTTLYADLCWFWDFVAEVELGF